MTKYIFFGSGKPTFTGTPGYTPLPLDTPYEAMTHQQVVDEIRHYITIAEQKQQWIRAQKRMGVFFTKKRK
jgi:hypothetical protein